MKINFVGACFLASILFCLILFIAVIATGNTFGQRCAVKHDEGSPAWHQCVSNLAKGITHE